MSSYEDDFNVVAGNVADPYQLGNAVYSGPTDLQLTRDGSLRVAEQRDTFGLYGRVFAANYGQGTSYVTAKTALTAAQPDFNLDIPNGVAVYLLSIGLTFGAMTGTANQFFVQTGSGLVGNGTSSAATVGPTNMLRTSPFASVCTARQAYSGSGTAPANPLEIFALNDPTAATGSVPLSFTYQPPSLFPLVGPASLSGYGVSTTTALTFKCVLVWAEVASDLI